MVVFAILTVLVVVSFFIRFATYFKCFGTFDNMGHLDILLLVRQLWTALTMLRYCFGNILTDFYHFYSFDDFSGCVLSTAFASLIVLTVLAVWIVLRVFDSFKLL